MQMPRGLTVAFKIYFLIALLATGAMAMGLLGLQGMRSYGLKVTEMRNASQRAITGEQINGLIYSVVMDSRGIYMAKDRAEAEKFGKPLLATLEAIGKAFDAWKALLPEARRPELTAAGDDIAHFIAYRRELVRLAEEVGNPTAREYGDNDLNRANRSALNRKIQALAAANARDRPSEQGSRPNLPCRVGIDGRCGGRRPCRDRCRDLFRAQRHRAPRRGLDRGDAAPRRP